VPGFLQGFGPNYFELEKESRNNWGKIVCEGENGFFLKKTVPADVCRWSAVGGSSGVEFRTQLGNLSL